MSDQRRLLRTAIDSLPDAHPDWLSVQSRPASESFDPDDQPSWVRSSLRKASVIVVSLAIAFGGVGLVLSAWRAPGSSQAQGGSAGMMTPASPTPSGSDGVLPTEDAVTDGRYLYAVELGDGELRVDVAPPGAVPSMSMEEAVQEVWSSSAVPNSASRSVLGFGLVSNTVDGSGIPALDHVPAWVGFAWGGIWSCGEIPVGAPSPVSTDAGYVAVVVGLADGGQPFTYSSQSLCGDAAGSTVKPASQVVSVEWSAVNDVAGDQVTVLVDSPSCATRPVATASEANQTVTVEIDVVVPLDASTDCDGSTSFQQTVNLPPGWLGNSADLKHAELGPVNQLRG